MEGLSGLACHPLDDALWVVQLTHQYMARRTQEGMSKQEIIRCLKRYVAREIYRELIPRAALATAA
jgi:hypothetical protein